MIEHCTILWELTLHKLAKAGTSHAPQFTKKSRIEPLKKLQIELLTLLK